MLQWAIVCECSISLNGFASMPIYFYESLVWSQQPLSGNL
jgi:hypothetical protein